MLSEHVNAGDRGPSYIHVFPEACHITVELLDDACTESSVAVLFCLSGRSKQIIPLVESSRRVHRSENTQINVKFGASVAGRLFFCASRMAQVLVRTGI